MKDGIRVPIKVVGGDQWGDLNSLGLAHEICGEVVTLRDQNYSFAGGHRVRLYKFKKNVHWKIPRGTVLDISGVVPAAPPRKQGR